MSRFEISKNIKDSNTLPAKFYRDKHLFEEVKEKVFDSTWHYVADAEVVKNPGDVFPFILLEGVLDESLLLSRDLDGKLRCLSNVCTHRGKIIVEKSGNQRSLTCGYHGRCFNLNGNFKRMPAFEEAENFPTNADHLTSIPLEEWMGMIFVAIDPKFDLKNAVTPILERINWMPLDGLQFVEEGTNDYFIDANWALYCDNFLEGFHIPFVHPALNSAIEFEKYESKTYDFCSLQIGVAKDGEPHFDLPKGQPDYGQKIYAYYFHLFPNLMLNFYPWGLSLNIVEPLGHNKTRVRFRTYRFKNTPFEREANSLELTELEDEAVVESVQLGLQSRFYNQGRFSPTMEKCVHHFHYLIDMFMTGEGAKKK